jgi:hypothetical protein
MAAKRPTPTPAPPRKAGGSAQNSARDREMGRDSPPAGDLGRGERTWSPPANEQGISNRTGDGHAAHETAADRKGRTSLTDPPAPGVPSQQGIRGHAQDERPNDEKKTRDRGGRS